MNLISEKLSGYYLALIIHQSIIVEYCFRNVGNALDTCITNYDKFILAGDFNAEVLESKIDNFAVTMD